MISTQDIKNKEVINIHDGKSLGFVEDIEVNLEKGTIEGIIVPEPRGFFSFFGRGGEHVIRWRDIKRIGDDVILVDVAGVMDSDYDDIYDREYDDGYRYNNKGWDFRPGASSGFHLGGEEREDLRQPEKRTEEERGPASAMREQENEDEMGK